MNGRLVKLAVFGWAFVMSVSLCNGADGKSEILFDFEEGTQGWKVDWASQDAPPQMSTAQSHHGKTSLELTHRFKSGQETVGGVVTFEKEKDFSKYTAITGWVWLPEHSAWEAQMYVRSGEGWTLSWGKLEKGLTGGWHRVEIKTSSIENPGKIRDIGVQVKNYDLEGEATIHIDEIETIQP